MVVLSPSRPEPKCAIVIAVTPFRGGKGGGNATLITGRLFVEGETTVAVGGKECTDAKVSGTTSLTCKAPAGTGLVDVAATANGVAGFAPDAYWHMNA